MPVQSLVLACSSTPQTVAGSFTPPMSHGHIRVRLKMIAGTGYLGSSDVSTGGYPLSTGDQAIDVRVGQGESLWVASSSGASATLAILRGGETT